MEKYVILTKVKTTADGAKPTESLIEINDRVSEKIKEDCPEVKWIENLAVLGKYDYLDIFEAPGNEDAFKVASIIRSFGHARTEVWPVTNWNTFKDIIGDKQKAYENAMIDQASKDSFPASDPPSFNSTTT